MKTFFRVRLHSVPSTIEDILSSDVFAYGSTGLSEALKFSQPDLVYDPEILHSRRHDLDVFFPSKPTDDFFQRLRELNPDQSWEVFEEPEKDWLEEWKKDFKPFNLVADTWIVPSWCEVPKEAKQVIQIDPGMAFGTGTHATTKMAAYFVSKIALSKTSPGRNMIDVGAGTGILSILAGLNGVSEILAVEIDPEARRVCRENIALNRLESKVKMTDALIEEIHSQFDIVVANIIDGVLIQLMPYLLRAIKPGGDIFLTGILVEREEIFLSQFVEKSGLKIVRRIENDEWVGYWLN